MAQQDMEQPTKKKSPDNIPPTGEEPEKKKPGLNIYWIYGLIFISIISYTLFRGVNSDGFATDKLKFYEMVKQGDVESIKTIRNQKLVRVFLNKDSVKNKAARYKQLLNTPEDDK